MTAMATLTIAGHVVDIDHEGYMQKPEQWNKDIALEIARDVGINDLTDRHWLVIEYMRSRYLEKGSAPSIRSLGKESGVPMKELYKLFPKGPAKLAARIAGIPKPRGCI
jgi:tRNA 2-thiouridine synthesizing protein E